jgi:endonuclease/exonuclease/phosphatase family metal-dependent hydrolase
MAYNVRGFRDGWRRVAAVVSDAQPDVLLLNESGSRRGLRRFARAVGMQVASDPLSPFRRRVKNTVLVRPPWRILRHRLHRFADVRRALYPRGALIAHVGGSGWRLWAVSFHLGLHPLERLHAAEELADLTRGLRGAAILGGDANETPDGRAIGFLADRFWDAGAAGDVPTFPARDPTARIDYLFVTEELSVDAASVPGDRVVGSASDHRPVLADLTLAEGEQAVRSDG